jgi:mRNA interferase YafQ
MYKKLITITDLLVKNINSGIEHHLLLPSKYCLHKIANKSNVWDCHIEPDWLLLYYLDDEVLRLERTGTHSDLFR